MIVQMEAGVPEEDDTIMVGLDSGGQGEAVKFSIVDLPFTNNQGDITAVTAGNGLTGGGTTGAVTLTVGAGTRIDCWYYCSRSKLWCYFKCYNGYSKCK